MPENPNEENLKLTIFAAVTLLWAIAFLVDIFNNTFEVPAAVHGLMATIIGYFVGSRLKRPNP